MPFVVIRSVACSVRNIFHLLLELGVEYNNLVDYWIDSFHPILSEARELYTVDLKMGPDERVRVSGHELVSLARSKRELCDDSETAFQFIESRVCQIFVS